MPDSDRVVRCHSAIDDSLYDALAALTADKPLTEPDAKFIGCGVYIPQNSLKHLPSR